MKAVVVIAFYVWLALTVAIVLGRLARWSASRSATKRRRKARLATQALGVETIATSPPPRSNPPISVTPPSDAAPSINLASSRAASESTSASAEPVPAASVAPAEPAAPPERRSVERRRGDRRHADRREPDNEAEIPAETPIDAEPVPEPQPVASGSTVAHLLAGFAMPRDLTPIAPAGGTPSDQATSLISRDREAYDVGTNIADELERLGYALQPVGETQLLATREEEHLSVMIDPEPHETAPQGARRFPTANAGDVVVEFWVGSGARP